MPAWRCLFSFLVVTLFFAPAAADDPVDYVREIKPILAARCYACHGAIKQKGELRVDTAAFMKKGGENGAALVPGKTIVLTGAMVPYAFGSSDGLFNLGSAISYAQSLPPGVYIAMNGTHFEWHNVRKNRETGVFEAIQRVTAKG